MFAIRFKKFLLYFVGICLCTCLFFIGVVVFFPINISDFETQETTKIFDRKGNMLYELLLDDSQKKTYISLSDISPNVIEATLSIEDRNFYSHPGVNIWSTLRAIWQNISHKSRVSGGSTIDQQLVRNVIHRGQARGYSQKIIESILALRMSFLYSKDDVLEKYLNTIYYGNLRYGIESASQLYFGKSAQLLSLAEASFLVGIPQSPSRLNPYVNFDEVKKRQIQVLQAMVDNGVLSHAEYESVITEELILQQNRSSLRAPHFIDFILPQLETEFGYERLFTGGIKIFTSLDGEIQEKVEEIIEKNIAILESKNVTNASVVVMENSSGKILAMVGSKDYFSDDIDGKFNVALAPRQPGSAIKPLVYILAFEKGAVPSTLIEDEPTRFTTIEGFFYAPKNFDLQYRGTVTLRDSLGSSLNIPAVKLLHFLGIDDVLQNAARFGITSFQKLQKEHVGLSLALGGGEVTLLELVQMYSVFANNGKLTPYNWLERMESRNGTADWEGVDFDYTDTIREVVDKKYAYLITDILSDNNARIFSFGEESVLDTVYPSAVKTGTTRNFKDNWTIGYSPEYTVGVWVGNNNNSPMVDVSGITGAAPIWRDIMDMLHKESSVAFFDVPKDVYTSQFCFNGKCGKEVFVKNTKIVDNIDADAGGESVSSSRLIQKPFDKSVYEYNPEISQDRQRLLLESKWDVTWEINGEFIGKGKKIFWPLSVGSFKIQAKKNEQVDTVDIYVQ